VYASLDEACARTAKSVAIPCEVRNVTATGSTKMKTTGIAFIVSAITGAVLASASSASATPPYGWNYPAFMCTTTSGTTTFNGGELSNETGSTATLYCPLVSNDSTISSSSIYFYSNGLNEATLTGTGCSDSCSVIAEICDIGYNTGTGTCGGYSGYDGAAGSVSIGGIAVTEYNNGDFNYMIIKLGADSGSVDNTLYGYQIQLAAQ
jgi:hypothetical protein